MRKSVTLYIYPDDKGCQEIVKFLETKDVIVNIRDIKKQPLTVNEVTRLVRHLNLEHFLDSSSKIYAKKKLDKNPPSRAEAIEMMANDNDLIAKPIILGGRLMVIGPNERKLVEMLRLKEDGTTTPELSNYAPRRVNRAI